MKKLVLSGLSIILLVASAPASAQGSLPFRDGTDFSSGDAVPCYSNAGALQYRRAIRSYDGEIRNVIQKRDPAISAHRDVPVPKAYSYAESGYKSLPRWLVTVYSQVPDEEGHTVRRPVSVDLGQIILAEAKKNNLDPLILELIVKRESNFNPYAVSRTGAQGLMQLMPTTAALMGVKDSFDPQQNVAGGAAYFAQQLSRFQDLGQALAAYNAGPNAVAQCGGVPPLAETQAYVATICSEYANRRKKAGSQD